jgi:hypothetical protein
VQEQMEQFFYELEDDQMLILQNFISAVRAEIFSRLD